MEVTNNPATTALSPSATAKGNTSQAAAVLSSDFETFLQMLTAQARYQDPLEPIDSSEYAAQLAQFSMVEQQVLSNDLLTAITDELGLGTIAQLANWIGLEARTTSAVAVGSDPVTIFPKTEAGADEAVLVVSNAAGNEVARKQIPLGSGVYEWDGTNATGASVGPGTYSFAVESRQTGSVLATLPAESFARITEARREGNDTVFILNGGSEVSSAQITSLREAS
jgi:flagellar basal-body rod modification protein FlgD